MQKVRYELDPYNRLVPSGLRKFRQVLEGRFKTDGNNELSYHVKAPLSGTEKIPHQIRLKGAWSLTDDHKLRLTLDKSGRETFGDELTLEGDIIDLCENKLLFALTTATKENVRSTYVLAIGGTWKADERNRLSFHVKREGGNTDILTFTGTWELDNNNQIIYQYEKARLIRKKRQAHTLTFKGYWQVLDNSRISYVLSKDTDSVFNFTTAASVFKEDHIQYELGMGFTDRKKPALRTIRIFGTWTLKKGVGLTFEVEYGNGHVSAIVFDAEVELTDKGTVAFKLRSAAGHRDLGITLELSRKMLKGDGEAFLRILASQSEAAIYAGAAWRW
jgi:hypothetical protein